MSENWWIAIVTTIAGFLLTLSAGGAAWMFKVHALLATISEAMKSGAKNFEKLFDRTEEHGKELTRHAARLDNLERDLNCQED